MFHARLVSVFSKTCVVSMRRIGFLLYFGIVCALYATCILHLLMFSDTLTLGRMSVRHIIMVSRCYPSYQSKKLAEAAFKFFQVSLLVVKIVYSCFKQWTINVSFYLLPFFIQNTRKRKRRTCSILCDQQLVSVVLFRRKLQQV